MTNLVPKIKIVFKIKFIRQIDSIEYAEFDVGVVFFHLIPEIPFLTRFGTKFQNFLFQVRFCTSSKSLQNSRMMLNIFFGPEIDPK